MAATVQGKGRRQRERGDNEKRIKREEREKKGKLNEELKMKIMQKRIDKQKRKYEEKQQKVLGVQTSTSENPQMRLHSSRNVQRKTRAPAVKKASGQLVTVRVGSRAHVFSPQSFR